MEDFLKTETNALGVEPCYFPMFVSEDALNKEKEHLEDFAPEVAWVTKSGSSDMDKPIAIRPTSETIMYPHFAKWIRSHRDLPMRLVQYCNVVRWEFKKPTPFLRTREFLWQEGHTAWEKQQDADEEVIQVLDIYARVYEELLAVPVIKGRKSQKEKFAGGDFTTTCEAFIPAAGKAIQGATSHSLGQNFAKMFDISFSAGEDASQKDKDKNLVWQNSWGITTRVLGVMIMVHGDNKGLVLPPRVAPIQVVGVCIYTAKDDRQAMEERCQALLQLLEEEGVRVKFDDRERTPGFKFACWEQRGVPLRLEIGPKDMANNQVILVRRDDGSRTTIELDDPDFAESVIDILDGIQQSLLEKAREERDNRTTIAWTWEEFLQGLKEGNLVLAPWSCTTKSEEWVKIQTTPTEEGGEDQGGSAKTLCIPFNQPQMPPGTKCFTGLGDDALMWCLWGRSY